MTDSEILLLFHIAFVTSCILGWAAFKLIHRNNKK